MSKRHNASRRRSYGRRQHELHERLDRRHDRRAERAWRVSQPIGFESGPFGANAADSPYGLLD